MKAPVRRCALYTRKSSDEGLEQEFNSLDAQREACAAYVASQTGEGWKALPARYDDGGFSGGTMERPALQRLLADIVVGKVNIVVVYKIDRLTRSLADFARMVEIFERHEVSFVSVTQAFNTTTSMGRLTLNVLLSFAQFEREVTGERIRDKIAASKKKGMWMGGRPPLGYDVDDRKLVVNRAEAETVRHVFTRYAALKSVRALQDELERDGIVSKVRIDKYGRKTGGKPLASGALYLMLQNPIYRGRIVHKDRSYPGQHAAIIEDRLWNTVQKRLAKNRVERKQGGSARVPSLLAGLIYDADGDCMTPTHANKKGRRYRYYVTHSLIKRGRPKASEAARRVPAHDIERIVEDRLLALIENLVELHELLAGNGAGASEIEQFISSAATFADRWPNLDASQKRGWLVHIIDRVTVMPNLVEIGVRPNAIAVCLQTGVSSDVIPPAVSQHEHTKTLTVAAQLTRTGIEKKLLIDDPARRSPSRAEANLQRLMARAYDFQRTFIAGGKPIAELAKEAGVTKSYYTRLLRLSFLAPDITRAILRGRQPADLNATKLMTDTRLPLDWQDQRKDLRCG
jgi:site-specific DNA recombinase